jgi:2-oxoglutarate ferredoxin oxidoreductase subunit beta
VVELQKGEDPIAAGVAVHNELYETPAYAFALASLKRPEFPLPIGVFRAVETATYDALLQGQVAGAIVKRGVGSLDELLHSGDTWTVDEN